jgi:hypothetical protein
MDLHIPELDNLRDLLTDLPHALPCPSERDSDYPFLSFELDDAVLQYTNGDVARAVGQMLWSIFIVDGELLICERGPSICAVVDVLRKYISEYPNSDTLRKWVSDIGNAAKGVYKSHGIMVSHPSFNDITMLKTLKIHEGASVPGDNQGIHNGLATISGQKRKAIDDIHENMPRIKRVASIGTEIDTDIEGEDESSVSHDSCLRIHSKVLNAFICTGYPFKHFCKIRHPTKQSTKLRPWPSPKISALVSHHQI